LAKKQQPSGATVKSTPNIRLSTSAIKKSDLDPNLPVREATKSAVKKIANEADDNAAQSKTVAKRKTSKTAPKVIVVAKKGPRKQVATQAPPKLDATSSPTVTFHTQPASDASSRNSSEDGDRPPKKATRQRKSSHSSNTSSKTVSGESWQ